MSVCVKAKMDRQTKILNKGKVTSGSTKRKCTNWNTQRKTKVTPHRKGKSLCMFCLSQMMGMDTGLHRYLTEKQYGCKWTAVSLVSEVVYKEKLHHLTPQPTKITLKTYSGETVPVRGIVTLTVKLNKQKVKLPLYIVKGTESALLGRTWLEKIKLNWQEIHMVAKVEDINLRFKPKEY